MNRNMIRSLVIGALTFVLIVNIFAYYNGRKDDEAENKKRWMWTGAKITLDILTEKIPCDIKPGVCLEYAIDIMSGEDIQITSIEQIGGRYDDSNYQDVEDILRK